MVRRLFLRPVAVLLGAVCLINGCHSWKQEPLSAASLNARQLSSARVRMMDGRQMTILQPQMVGDSLVGHFDSIGPGPASQPRTITPVLVSVAMARVRSVETRHVSVGRTVLLTLALVWGLGVFAGGTHETDCSQGCWSWW